MSDGDRQTVSADVFSWLTGLSPTAALQPPETLWAICHLLLWTHTYKCQHAQRYRKTIKSAFLKFTSVCCLIGIKVKKKMGGGEKKVCDNYLSLKLQISLKWQYKPPGSCCVPVHSENKESLEQTVQLWALSDISDYYFPDIGPRGWLRFAYKQQRFLSAIFHKHTVQL